MESGNQENGKPSSRHTWAGSCWPSSFCQPGDILLSPQVAANLQVSIGDEIQLAPVQIQGTAKSIQIQSQTKTRLAENQITDLEQVLYYEYRWVQVGIPVHYDSHVFIITVINSSTISTFDSDSQGANPVFYSVWKNTKVELLDAPKEGDQPVKPQKIKTSGWKSLGGLKHVMETLEDLIVNPFKNPDVYQRFNIEPPTGILLYGPPGTGKTRLVKALSEELGIHLTVVNGGELSSQYVGETESRLRNVFEEARNHSPAIVFLDEMDALCPKREESNNETEKRVVATLLTLMDGLSVHSKEHRLLVVGATNRPHSLDPALRRPGRFDRELEIGIPNPTARAEILKVQLEQYPNTVSSEQLKELATSTHGYVGADLAGLCREAALMAMKRYLIQDEKESAGKDPNQNEITYTDLMRAKLHVRPSAMREISLDIPNVRWSDIGGQASVQRQLQECIQWPIEHPEAFAKLGIDPPKGNLGETFAFNKDTQLLGILLYGPPGCSKTLLAKALATELQLNFLAVKGAELLNKYVGESERAVQTLFKKARQASPSIVFLDEVDAIAYRRGGMSGTASQGNSVADRVLTQLLTELDGIESLNGVTIIAATNRPDVLDPAIMRPGRLDRLLYIPPPDVDAREQILLVKTKKMPLHQDVDLKRLAQKMEGFSGAETVAVVREAGMNAMKENPESVTNVRMCHFESALVNMKPRITSDMIAFYEKFHKAI